MQTLVISNDERLGNRVRNALLQEGRECPVTHLVLLARAAGSLAGARPGLVVLVLSPEPEQALRILSELRALTPAVILAVGPASDPKQILRTLRGGAREYLDETEVETELPDALRRLQGEESAAEPAGRIITVLGTSGGCGASTLAVNLATALAQDKSRSLLVDLKLDTGDLAALLDVRPAHTLADLCQQLPVMDRTMVERSLVRHESGVHLLASPRRQASVLYRLSTPAPGGSFGAGPDQVTPEGVRQVLLLARILFPFVVADLHPSFREEQVQALRQADVVLLTFRLDFTSLRNTRRALEHLECLGVGRDRVRLVANRFGQPKEVPADKACDALGLAIAHFIPDDPATINRANNFGIPAVLNAPRSRIGKSFQELARKVNGRKDP